MMSDHKSDSALLLRLLKNSAAKGKQRNDVLVHFNTALSVLVNQKAKPATRRLAYSFLRGCKGHGSPSWTSTVTPVIVNDASSPDEHIAAAALRLIDSYPSESLALSLPSIAPLLLGILRGKERGGERVRCEAVNLLYSLLLSPDRSDLRERIREDLLESFTDALLALPFDASPAVCSLAFQNLAAGLSQLLPPSTRPPLQNLSSTSSFPPSDLSPSLSPWGGDFASTPWACGGPHIPKNPIPSRLAACPSLRSSLHTSPFSPLPDPGSSSDVLDTVLRSLSRKLMVLVDRQKSLPVHSKRGTTHLLTILSRISMLAAGENEAAYNESASVLENALAPLLRETDESLIVEGAQGILFLSPFLPLLATRHLESCIDSLLALVHRTLFHHGAARALNLALDCYQLLPEAAKVTHAAEVLAATLMIEDRRARTRALLVIIWTSLWSNAFQAALHGQEARWDLLFALPVIDLMSVEPERTSELKVDVVCCFCQALVLPQPQPPPANTADAVVAAARGHAEGFSLSVLELFHSSLRWEGEGGGCVASQYFRVLSRCCARASSHVMSPMKHREESRSSDVVGHATRVIEILQSLICSFPSIPLNSSRTRALCLLCEYLPLHSTSDSRSQLNSSALASLIAPHLTAGDKRDQEIAAKVARAHTGVPQSSQRGEEYGGRCGQDFVDAGVVAQCMVRAASRQPTLCQGLRRSLEDVVRMKGKGGSGSGDSSLNQLLSASLEQINQIEAVYNSGGDAAGQFFGGVPLTASAPPSEEEEEEEGVYRRGSVRGGCALESGERIGAIDFLLEDCVWELWGGGTEGGGVQQGAGSALSGGGAGTVVSGCSDVVHVMMGHETDFSRGIVFVWAVLRNRSPLTLQNVRLSLTLGGGLKTCATDANASILLGEFTPSGNAAHGGFHWRVPLTPSSLTPGSATLHMHYRGGDAKCDVIFRGYSVPASSLLTAYPGPECDTQSFAKLWASMGGSHRFSAWSRGVPTCALCPPRGMDTCRGIHLNLGSFAHVAIDDEGEGQALRFQMAGVGYSVGGEYAAVAVTGTRSGREQEHWDLVVEIRTSNCQSLEAMVSVDMLPKTVHEMLGGDVTVGKKDEGPHNGGLQHHVGLGRVGDRWRAAKAASSHHVITHV